MLTLSTNSLCEQRTKYNTLAPLVDYNNYYMLSDHIVMYEAHNVLHLKLFNPPPQIMISSVQFTCPSFLIASHSSFSSVLSKIYHQKCHWRVSYLSNSVFTSVRSLEDECAPLSQIQLHSKWAFWVRHVCVATIDDT